MKVKELIAALKKLDQNLEVYGYCDHGQSPEKVSLPQVIYTVNPDHCLWGDWTPDVEDAEEYGYENKAVLL